MAVKPLPPRFINQGDHIPLAVWTWQAHTLGRAASVSEIEAFLRAPCPGGLELTEDDADRALAALVKYQGAGAEEAKVVFAVRGGLWTPRANRCYGLKGTTFEAAQAAFTITRGLETGASYRTKDLNEAIAWVAVVHTRLVDGYADGSGWEFTRTDRATPRWVDGPRGLGPALFKKYPSLAKAGDVADIVARG